MEVRDGIHRIEAPFGERTNAAYLLAGTEAGLLIDTTADATAEEYIGGYLEHNGYDLEKVRYVVNTHSDWDHIGGNAAVRELVPHALFMCHELDRPMIEDIERMIDERYCEFVDEHGLGLNEGAKEEIRRGSGTTAIDLSVRGEETVHLGADWRVRIVHTPGHSRGSISVEDPRSHSLIVGDAVLRDGIPLADGTPAFPPTYRYVETYIATAQRLQAMDPDCLLTSHYPSFDRGESREFLGETLTFVDRVEERLRRALATKGPSSVRELIEELAPDLGRWNATAQSALSFALVGHLERLVAYDLASVLDTEGVARFRYEGA